MFENINFWTKIELSDNQCWLWTGAKDKDGYGLFKINRIMRRAHRLMYEAFYGTFNKKLLVCHTCDNPSCVRPKHLFLGTAKDNNNDAVRKGRYKAPSGDKHWTKNKSQVRDTKGRFKSRQ